MDPNEPAPTREPDPADDGRIELEPKGSLWERVFVVAPLVVVGTREGSGYDLAPKHLAMPLGWGRDFGFVCSQRHATYRNLLAHRAFTVTYPRPDQVVLASLAASPRDAAGDKPTLASLPTFPARVVDGIFLEDGTLFLECELDRIIDGFDGDASLVVGRIVAARAHPDIVSVSDLDPGDALRAALLAYVSPGRFAAIDDTRAFPFPADFRR